MDSVILYLKESYNELLNKVTWPTLTSLLQTTRLVIVASLLIAGVIFLMDSVSNQILSIIYSLN